MGVIEVKFDFPHLISSATARSLLKGLRGVGVHKLLANTKVSLRSLLVRLTTFDALGETHAAEHDWIC